MQKSIYFYLQVPAFWRQNYLISIYMFLYIYKTLIFIQLLLLDISQDMNKSKTAVTGKGPAPVNAPKTSWKDRISTADYQELKATFDLFDEDGGGTIDPIEVEKILQELGLKGRSSIVFEMINGIKEVNRPIKFEEFLEIICSKVGDVKSRDGLQRIFQIWDHQGHGFVDFESFKRIARQLGQTLNDDELTELMHNAYIMNGTQTHDNFSFDEFYTIVTKKR